MLQKMVDLPFLVVYELKPCSLLLLLVVYCNKLEPEN